MENQKFHFLTKIYEIQNKRWDEKIFCLKTVYKFFSFLRYLNENIEQRICLEFCIANGISCAEGGSNCLNKTFYYNINSK